MKELNDENFNQHIENSKVILVDFYATWCGPCGMQADVLNKIYNSRSLELDIVKVNVDKAPRLSAQYSIDAIPTMLVFKDGKLLKRIVGYTEETELLKTIQEIQ